MATYTDDQISTWAQIYEKEVIAKNDLIADRISLQVIKGSNQYEVPNYVTNIRSVLWLGKELHAKGFTGSMITGDTPFETAGSIPFEYVFSGKGMRVLKFYPSPNINIAQYVGDLWTPDADRYAVIVEFFRTPDYTSTPQKKLPEWLRQYIIKDYVCWKAFTSEGTQQDLRASKYYQQRLDEGATYLKEVRENMFASIVSILYDRKMLGRRKPGKPVLPPNFGYPVNW